MKRFTKAIILLASFALVAITLTAVLYAIKNDPELANKPEWSTLQAVEATHRNDVSLQRVTIIKNFGSSSLDVVGIRSTKGEPTVWILASPQIAPLVKVMPENIKVQLTDAEFEKIKSSVELNEETEAFLFKATE